MASYRSSNGSILEALGNRMGTLSHQASEMGRNPEKPPCRRHCYADIPRKSKRNLAHRPSLEYSRLTLAPTESSARCGSGSTRPNYIAPLSIYASSKPKKKKKKSRFLWVMLSSVPTRPGPAMLRISRLFEFAKTHPHHVTLIPLPLQLLCLLPEACLGLAGEKLRVKRLVVV